MGTRYAIRNKDCSKCDVFENTAKGIGDFVIDLNTFLFENGYDLRIGKFGDGYKINKKYKTTMTKQQLNSLYGRFVNKEEK